MRKTKTVQFKETVDVYVSPSSSVSDTEDDSYLTNIARHIAKRAIATAVKIVKGSNPVWVPKGLFCYKMATISQLTNAHLLCRRR